MAKEGTDGPDPYALREVRHVRLNCMATIGQVGKHRHENVQIGKDGPSSAHMGCVPPSAAAS